eukprot:TRINITY_DN20956_c0_g1_i1.p1 TRINITY_DN20956_c0_g1~~TRINITY_DN20956_c0_g1_i1.p1  ORF type:complete len:192 (+),score=45.75 TRINITY_DN20956_c0_g1_i1:20-595(+)
MLKQLTVGQVPKTPTPLFSIKRHYGVLQQRTLKVKVNTQIGQYASSSSSFKLDYMKDQKQAFQVLSGMGSSALAVKVLLRKEATAGEMEELPGVVSRLKNNIPMLSDSYVKTIISKIVEEGNGERYLQIIGILPLSATLYLTKFFDIIKVNKLQLELGIDTTHMRTHPNQPPYYGFMTDFEGSFCLRSLFN